MAAPADKTTKNLSGTWYLNSTLSDSAEPGLALQGIGYLIRKGISLASICVEVNQYEAPPKPPNTSTDNFTHVDIVQSASGLSSTQENRCLDQEWREHSDWLFGTVKGQSQFVSLADIEDEYLKGGWESGENLIRTYVESLDADWTADQIWGFQNVEGERRYCRNVLIKKGDERAELRLVYDYYEADADADIDIGA